MAGFIFVDYVFAMFVMVFLHYLVLYGFYFFLPL
jgi:hypothetical protein